MCATDKAQISRAILAYLADHPKAQDTIEGVTEWWVLEQNLKRQTAHVKESLAELVSQRLLLERRGRDKRLRYRLNRRKSREIAAILAQLPE
jgi:hypothetical protein